MTSYRGKVK